MPTKAATTIRCRMMWAAAACLVGTLAVAGVALTFTFERHVMRMIGRDLDARWAELARSVTIGADGRLQMPASLFDQRYKTPRSGAYWQIQENGAPALLSASLAGRPMEFGDEANADGRWFEVETPDGQELYVIQSDATVGAPDARRQLRIAAALDHDQIGAARTDFGWGAARVLGLIALFLGLAAWFQIRVTLDPLRRLGQELEVIRDGERTRFQAALPGEVAPLADALNALLDRQEEQVKKARDRAGALAHGLKTPLTILAAEARRIRAGGDPATAARLDDQISALQTHVERELARARANGPSIALGAYVDASRTAERVLRVVSLLPRGETLKWRCDAPEGLMLRMDPDDFGEVLGNLLDNARKWAANQVALRYAFDGAAVRVTVEDDGPGFGANAAPTRLTAGDRENSAGLGLVIVQDILANYGATLWIDRAAAQGLVSFSVPGRLMRSASPDARLAARPLEPERPLRPVAAPAQ